MGLEIDNKIEIIIILILAVIVIIWLQYPEIKENEDEPKLKKIFNRFKIPIISICFIIIIYMMFKCTEKTPNVNITQRVSIGIPDF